MNKKDIIKNHIISLILGHHLIKGSKLPSEKMLAQSNNCSRNPVRQALKELTCADWIQPQKGRGYFVSNFGDYETFFAKGAYGITETIIRSPHPFENHYLQHIAMTRNAHIRTFVKEYLRDNKLVMKTINSVQNDYIFGLKEDEIKRGFIQSLLKNQIAITHQNREIKMLPLHSYDQKQFGWKHECPAIITSLYAGKEMIERSIIIIQKKHFVFKKKIIF